MTNEAAIVKTNRIMKTEKKYFRLFACCIPVKGARRSTICDLQRQTFAFIPNGLYDILTQHRDETIEDIKSHYDQNDEEVIDEYFEFLVEQEYGFWCDDPTLFPDLDLTWESPELITNALIDVDEHSEHNFPSIYQQLDDLGCKALQLRFFSTTTVDSLRQILEGTRHGRLRSIELLFPYHPDLTRDVLSELCYEHPRVSYISVHSAPEDDFLVVEGSDVPIHYRKRVVDGPHCCGEVHPGYFIPNIELFTEAQHFNTCLNRKISIDTRGEIKNCPALPLSFGNVSEVSLHSIIARQKFRDLWNINKDQIEVCKDCEFRYICTDCRAYLSRPDDLYSKPSKCTYDPYTAEWN